jgi:hypothetical protein
VAAGIAAEISGPCITSLPFLPPSFLPPQAGARVVYAVEASGAARWAAALAAANPELGSRVRVLRGRVEEIRLPEQVDVLVSEPMGTLLLNERMVESYVYARDAFLKPGGRMYPVSGEQDVWQGTLSSSQGIACTR